MRLRKNRDGWRANGLWKKNQYPSVQETVLRLPTKKNTNRWCGGKRGRKHDYQLSAPKNKSLLDYKLPVCQVCGKQDYRGTLYKDQVTGLYKPLRSIF